MLLNKLDKNIGLRDFDELDDYNKRIIDEDLRGETRQNLENKKMRYQFYKKFPQKQKLKFQGAGIDEGALENLADYDFKSSIKTHRKELPYKVKSETLLQHGSQQTRLTSNLPQDYSGTIAYSNNSIISSVFPKTYPIIHPQFLLQFFP